ncbi:MAG TPA: hypothetical protein VMD48_03760 [Solirubrobacteraceae bacterium]|nr:hypothetical protein [Solirubrobacteraceae bacterium]
MGTEEPEGLDLELLAASFRTDLGDLGAFVEGLAAKLEELLPTRVRVDRKRAGFRGPKLVERIEFDAGDRRLELRYDGRTVEPRYSRLSGGIVLKSESVGIDAWLDALNTELANEAQRSATTREALERLLLQ